MEINVNFVFFEELQEKPQGSDDMVRIVVLRQSQDAKLALDDGGATFFPLD